MKKSRKLTIGVLVALLMLVLGATTIMAASSEKKLAANKWVTVTNENYNTYYKVTVKNDGYLTITAKNQSSSRWMDITIYKKSKGEYQYVSNPLYTNAKSGSSKIALQKGTYYIKAYGELKFKYKFTKEAYKANYCASKAVELKKNKEIVIVNTPKNTYDRWYKIKLTKKQAITYWAQGSGSITIYDSNMNVIDILSDSEDYTEFYTREKLKKGTYYVCISGYISSSVYNRATITTFKWK